MKPFRLIIAAAFIAGMIAVSTQAQPATNRPAQQAPATTTTAQGTPGPVVMAVISTAQFESQQGGVLRLVAAATALQREFQPRSAEIQQLQQQLQTLASQIESTQSVARPEETAQRRRQAEELQVRITRATEDARAAYNRRLGEVLVPINRDIATSLEAYARGRGITVIFDISRLGEVMFITSPTIDITTDFIADYNRRNPATVSATPTTTTTPGGATNTGTPARNNPTTPARRP